MSHSKNRLQPQLIKYDASTDADALNQSLKLGVTGLKGEVHTNLSLYDDRGPGSLR